jgi:hypothetical protein
MVLDRGEHSQIQLLFSLLTFQIASLIGSGQQKLAGRLYTHLTSQPQYQTPEQRQALVRRLREAMVKCIIINGIPVVIEAVTAVSDVERPEDRDLSCSREDWQIGPETSERAAAVLKVLYKSEKGGHVKTLQAHRDIRVYSARGCGFH